MLLRLYRATELTGPWQDRFYKVCQDWVHANSFWETLQNNSHNIGALFYSRVWVTIDTFLYTIDSWILSINVIVSLVFIDILWYSWTSDLLLCSWVTVSVCWCQQSYSRETCYQTWQGGILSTKIGPTWTCSVEPGLLSTSSWLAVSGWWYLGHNL